MNSLRVIRSLVFVLTLQCTATAGEPGTMTFHIDKSPTTITITNGEVPQLTYRFTEVPSKPFVATFCTPSGVNVLRDAPLDHLHHHGLMFGVAAEGLDYWHEFSNREHGWQVHRGIETAIFPKAVPLPSFVSESIGSESTRRNRP